MSDKKVEVKVMMFGGRRCGKTSVLAAMQSCFEEKFGRGNLMIYADDDDTMIKLEEKSREISSYFHNQGKSRSFTPDSAPTLDIIEYRFNINLKNKDSDGMVVDFIDYPGEWLDAKKYPDKYKMLGEMIKKVHIIIIAIDSPHLMEQTNSDEEDAVGQFNDNRNYSRRIGEWAKRNFSTKSDLSAKMVLFVPLKCEKYYHAGQMDILNKKIHKAYKDTFNFFTNNQQPYEVAITPILTCGDIDGGVEFDRFERDEVTKEIILESEYQTPRKAFYIFTKKMAEPKPLYCEQPMIYILSYVLAMIKIIKMNEKKGEGFFGKIMRLFNETFLNVAAVEDFVQEQDLIKQAMKKNGNGYEIFSNPLNF